MKYYFIFIAVFLNLLVRETYQKTSEKISDTKQFLRRDLLNETNLVRGKIPHIIGGRHVEYIKSSPFVAVLFRKARINLHPNESIDDSDQTLREGEHIYDSKFYSGLRFHNETGFMCTASILTNQYLVTAAHCMVDVSKRPFNKKYPARKFMVYAGGLSINRRSFESKVSSFCVHPKFVYRRYPKFIYNDIAVVKIKRKFRFTMKINNIKLPFTSGSISRHHWKNCLSFGWGLTPSFYFDYNVYNQLLKVANVKIMDYDECARELPINELRQICTKDNGNSLGLLVCDRVLVGVTSFGQDAGIPIKGSVNTRVEYFVGWIKYIINGNENRRKCLK